MDQTPATRPAKPLAKRTAPPHLKKHQKLVVMKPEPGTSISVMARKIYTSILASSQSHLTRMERPMLATEVYRAPLSTLLNQIGLGEMQMRYAKEYVIEMAKWMVYWDTANRVDDTPAPDAEFEVATAADEDVKESMGVKHMLVSPKLERDDSGVLWLEWQLDAEINRMLDPRVFKDGQAHYAYINLVIAAKLSTYASLALYEICAKFKDNHRGGLTASKPTDWWIDALSAKAPAVGEKRRPWVKFKSEKVTPSLEEINAQTDLNIEMLEDKAAGTVQFLVSKKEIAPLALLAPTKVDYALLQQSLAVGVSEPRLTILIQEFGEGPVRASLLRLEEQISARGAAAIRNPFAWLKRVLENEREEVQGAPEPQQLLVAPPPPDQPPAKPVAGESEEAEMLARSNADFNLLAMSERQAWFERAVAELNGQGLRISPRELQRHADCRLGEGRGLLSSKVINLYAAEKYGADWRDKLGPRRIS